MVPFKNVTMTVTPVVQNVLADYSLDNPTTSTPVTGIVGYLEYAEADEIYATFNVVLKSPAFLQVECDQAIYFTPDAQVTVTASTGTGTYNGTVWVVHGRADMHDDGLEADHAMFALDQKTFPLS